MIIVYEIYQNSLSEKSILLLNLIEWALLPSFMIYFSKEHFSIFSSYWLQQQRYWQSSAVKVDYFNVD